MLTVGTPAPTRPIQGSAAMTTTQFDPNSFWMFFGGKTKHQINAAEKESAPTLFYRGQKCFNFGAGEMSYNGFQNVNIQTLLVSNLQSLLGELRSRTKKGIIKVTLN